MMGGRPRGASALDEAFDRQSGSLLERLLFNQRHLVLLLCLVATVLLGWQATRLQLNSSFEKTIPTQHPYIVNFLANKGELSASGNVVRVVVETRGATIFDADYMTALRKVSDALYLLPGVDRPRMKSLWTSNMRWIAVTEDGLDGGPLIPDSYDGSPGTIEQLRANVERSGEVGQVVAPNFKSSLVVVPLLAIDTHTGQPIDYAQLAAQLEQIRSTLGNDKVRIHIVGFAKVVGDLIDGIRQIMVFFVLTIAIAGVMLYWFTRCYRSTALVLGCSLVAVVWQLGLLPLLGYTLDPYSVLVPFLVFAIGMSHGAQKMNGIMQDIGRGMHRLVAARLTFRRLFLAGLTALLCDAVGFAVLLLINIKVIQDLAIIASIGVAMLIVTNLILLPICLSYIGVSPAAATRSLKAEAAHAAGADKHPLWRFLDKFTERRWALWAIAASLVLGAGGTALSLRLKIGDLDPGAPELRADSRYNRDAAFVSANYGASSDVFVVIVKTPANQCASYAAQERMDRLEWQMRSLEGVESTSSLSSLTRQVLVLMNEGNAKWYELIATQSMLNSVTSQVPPELFNANCDTLSLQVYLKDHKADTLSRVAALAEKFSAENSNDQVKFLLAGGNGGIEAATNMVVKQASREMLFWVYGAVALLCLVTFRSWRAVVCAVLPLLLTSVLAEALMVVLGMGVKVATLPVIALGVGIGVDYALYILSIVIAQLRAGRSLSQAYYHALLFTGRVVMLTGLTLAIGVATWVLSPIKFQADMGLLLAFMFLWNMLGALILLPALARFLLVKPGAARDDAGAARTDGHVYQPVLRQGETI
jgi:predicted RND superfamily exporter protein